MTADENRLTKRNTWIQIETLGTVIVMTFLIAGSYWSLTHQMESLVNRVSKLEQQFTRIETKLDTIISQQRVDSSIAKFRSRDRWTASMEEDMQEVWIEKLKQLHPDLRRADVPDIRQIQNRYPEGQE